MEWNRFVCNVAKVSQTNKRERICRRHGFCCTNRRRVGFLYEFQYVSRLSIERWTPTKYKTRNWARVQFFTSNKRGSYHLGLIQG